MALIFGVVLNLMSSERLSPRVRREIPRRFLGRLAALFLTNTLFSGILWMALMSMLVLVWLEALPFLGLPLIIANMPSFNSLHEHALRLCGLGFGYLLCYNLATLYLASLLGRWLKTNQNIPLFLGLTGGCMSLSWFATFLVFGVDAGFDNTPMLGNVFSLFHRMQCMDFFKTHLCFIAVILCVLLLLNRKWLLESLKDYRNTDGA